MHAGRDSRQTSGPAPIGQQKPIGSPVTFLSGKFSGKTVRTELQEIQKADLGRKYAKVDRRPLDPPPIVLLKYFTVTDVGTPNELQQEIENYQAIPNVGIMCSLDLFPVPGFLAEADSASSSTYVDATRGRFQESKRNELTYFPLHPFNTTHAEMPPFQIPRRQPMLKTINNGEQPRDVVYKLENHLITESSKLTPALVGEKFVEPVLVNHKGKDCLMFVFGDLAVQREGTFILRYRVFDIWSAVAGPDQHPILAECYGGTFRVYSTRDFPGLQASTELTKAVSRYGVRVTMRDSERKPKGRTRHRSNSNYQSSEEDVSQGFDVGEMGS
ncbi:velvet factor-domain-containing protein [Amanita rubescens]|nr:velvet factor-domain-containing protein [Amanita rubescens]